MEAEIVVHNDSVGHGLEELFETVIGGLS